MLTAEKLQEIVSAGCPACRRNHLRVRALGTGSFLLLDGEPVSAVRWPREGREPISERAYRIDCAECGEVLFSGDDCPLCHARGGLARALSGNHGLPPLTACPTCGHNELKLGACVRMHALYVLGREARSVVDAEPHEPGFHVLRADCPECERTVAEVSGRCGACGRSSLVRTPR